MNNYKRATQVLGLLAAICMIFFLLRRCGDGESSTGTVSEQYENTIQQLRKDYTKIELERDKYRLMAESGEKMMDSVVRASKQELNAYQEKSRREKNELIRRFQATIDISDDGNDISLDSSGVDSINKYVIVCEGIKEELAAAKTVITNQKGVIYQDSLSKNVLMDKFEVSDKEARKQAKDALRHKNGKRLYQGLCIGIAAIQTSIIYILASR